MKSALNVDVIAGGSGLVGVTGALVVAGMDSVEKSDWSDAVVLDSDAVEKR